MEGRELRDDKGVVTDIIIESEIRDRCRLVKQDSKA